LFLFDKNYPYSIYHFAILYSENDQGGSGFIPEDWKWLANLLIDAANTQPQIVLPHLVTLIFKTEHTFEANKYIHDFNIGQAIALFDNRLSEVMILLALDIDFNFLNTQEQDRMQFAKLTARKWLEENKI